MIKKIVECIWKIPADSNIYYVEDINAAIDTGNRKNREMVKTFLSKIVDLEKIEIVIFTHLHYDHIGNFDLFPNAKFYASKEAIGDIEKDKHGTILDKDMEKKFNIELIEISNIKLPDKYEIIRTPGHTRGSICLWDKEKQILFSGDTLLNEGHGRTDLPTSDNEEIQKTLVKLISYNFKILCPGHEY